MPTKLPALCLFMTKEDEESFSIRLREALPAVRFIDSYPWDRPEPPFYDSIANCYGRLNSAAAIINHNIITAEYYKTHLIASLRDGTEFHGAANGQGLIQLTHSKKANYIPDGLLNGQMSASYDPILDKETDQFVKTVWKVAKKHAFKLYELDPRTGLILHEKPSTKFYAWPDAVAKYDQVDGLFLTNNTMAYFTSKRD